MEYSLMTKLAAECVGTAILMIFGNGAVADVDLEGTKGHHSGWLTIAMGYGFGVMFPVLMFGGVSGAHINPAMTLGQAVIGIFPWSLVLPYILAQLVGAALGQLVVYACYFPHYRMTKDPLPILGTFCTTDASGSLVNYSSMSSLARWCWSWEPSAACRAHGGLRGWLLPPSLLA